jgi:T5SS/PEP-CTERM-associated repeat protein
MATISRWTGAHKTNTWFDAKNWAGGIPQPAETTLFNDGGTWTISLAGAASAQAGSLTVSKDNLTFTAGTLALDAPAATKGATEDLTISAAGAVTIAAGATLTANSNILIGTGTGTSASAGTLVLEGTAVTAGLSLAVGALTVDGPSGHLSATAALIIATTLTIAGGGVVDNGGNSGAVLTVGTQAAGAAATVALSGAGSELNTAQIVLGNVNAGTLSVAAGATVTAASLTAGRTGNGLLNITGPASTVSIGTISIGGASPVASAIDISAGGTLAIGSGNLTLTEGTLSLDTASSVTGGAIVSLGGHIDLAPAAGKTGGTFTLTPQLQLGTDANDFNLLTTVATGSAVLNLAGGIGSANSALLGLQGGHVILSNANDAYGGTEILSGTLEVAATGGAGAGTIMFLTGGTSPSILEVDSGVALNNAVAQFYTNDEIELNGFSFGAGVTGNYTGNFNGGELTLSNGATTTSLTLLGNYTQSDFTFSAEKQGGTLIRFHA